MMRVSEISKLAAVSVRTLQYYDKIGLLKPKKYTEAGYRLYDDEALEKLQQILLFKELEFPLKEIKRILQSPNYDKNKALEQQFIMLTLKKENIENILNLLNKKIKGDKQMDFSAFSDKKLEDYAKKAKEEWGKTEQFKEFEEKNKYRSQDNIKDIYKNLMEIFVEFGTIKQLPPENAQNLVIKLQSYITEHFYTCNNDILLSLAEMYSAEGEFKENIDKAGGNSTAEFVTRVIKAFVK